MLDRNIGIDRQPLDGGGNAGALAPALEAQLRFRRKQPRQRPRRGADRARQRLDVVGAGGIAQHDVGGAPAARLVRQRNEGRGILGLMQLQHREFDQKPGAAGVVAVIEQRQDRLVQQRRHPHHEFRSQACAAFLAPKPGQIEIQRSHVDIGKHVDRMFEPCRHPHRAVGRHQPPPLRGGHLHRAPGSID